MDHNKISEQLKKAGKASPESIVNNIKNIYDAPFRNGVIEWPENNIIIGNYNNNGIFYKKPIGNDEKNMIIAMYNKEQIELGRS